MVERTIWQRDGLVLKINPSLIGLVIAGLIVIGFVGAAIGDSNILLTLAWVIPATVVIHEAGHAASAWILGLKIVRISVGSEPLLLRATYNDLSFEVGLPYVSGGAVHTVRQPNRWREIGCLVMGPLSNALAALATYQVFGESAFAFIAMNAGVAFMNIVPFAWPEKGKCTKSDGGLVLVALFRDRQLALPVVSKRRAVGG